MYGKMKLEINFLYSLITNKEIEKLDTEYKN